MQRPAHWLILITLGTALVQIACGAEPPKQATGPMAGSTPRDGWKRSAVWLFATDRGASGPAAECKSVHELLVEEANCKGQLCQPGAELASEWLDKCSTLAAEQVDQVSDFQAAMADEAEQGPTACAKEFQRFKRIGCDRDKCLEQAQSWATRCGGTEGGPLGTRIVAQAVKRSIGTGEPVVLDARNCTKLAKLVQKSAFCESEEACKKAWPEVEAHRERCESDERPPDLATGLAQLGVALGSVREPETLLVSDDSDKVAQGEVPLALADGKGAIIGVCHKHPVTVEAYIRVRDRCAGARLTVARLFAGEDAGALRIGRLTIPSAVPLTGPYPWLAVAGEPTAAAKVRSEELGGALDEALAAPEGERVAKLVQVAHGFAAQIAESKAAQAALKARDAKLLPLIESLGKIKAAGAQQVKDRTALRGLLERAKHRPFADVRRDGKFELGAATAAYWLEAAALLPEAMTAYQKQLAPLADEGGAGRKLTAVERGRARQRAQGRARACVEAQERMKQAEQALLKCVFDDCEDGDESGQLEQWMQAHAAAQTALREADLALGPMGAEIKAADVAAKAGCDVRPW